MSGTGKTIVPVGGTMNLSSGTHQLNRVLENNGTANWTGGFFPMNNGTLLNNGSFTANSNSLLESYGSPSAGGTNAFVNAGTFTKLGSGTTRFYVVNSGVAFHNTGTVDVQAGTLSLSAGLANLSGTTLTGGSYVVSGTLRIVGADIRTNSASIILNRPGASILNDSTSSNAIANFGTNTAIGSFTIQNGRNVTVPGEFNNAGTVTIGEGSTFATSSGDYTQSAGTTTVSGTLDPAGVVDFQGGTLGGAGTILGNVTNSGDMAPGNSPGILTLQGDYIQTAGGTLSIEIGGPNSNQYDQLIVSGAVVLGGSIDIRLINGSVANVSDSFTIVHNDGANAVSGTFAGLGEGASFKMHGNKFRISYASGDGNDVVLTLDDINEAPTNLILSSEVVSENEPSAVVGTLTTTDPDAGDTFSYTIQPSGDGAQFAISGDQLLVGVAGLDYELGATRTIAVRTTDSGGLSFDRSFTIQIENTIEAGDAIYLATLTAPDGTTLFGADARDQSNVWDSRSVRNAGDVNGDGFDDLLLGAETADAAGNLKSNAGEAYVIFGGPSMPTTIDLASLGSAGIIIFGADAGDSVGISVSSAGDVNGDGFDDLLIGAWQGDAAGNAKINAGESYVVFGGASLPATIDLASLGTAGVTFFGADAGDQAGLSVSSVGDVNGDGFDDVLIGAHAADALGNLINAAGDAYLIFGGPSLPLTIDLANLGSAGVTIFGAELGDQASFSVSGVGDVNGDGFDDLLIGASCLAWMNSVASVCDATTFGPGIFRPGAGYLIFGSPSLPVTIDLADNLGTAGITFVGVDHWDGAGGTVSRAGDVDGDGLEDMFIGAWVADGPGNLKNSAGESYLIFGGDFASAITHQGTAASETLTGTSAADLIVGDRGNDLLVGNGGEDVLTGGQGNDVLAVSDLTFRRIVGGTGGDTLRLDGSELSLDLTALPDNRLVGIESIDITGNGNNTLTLNQLEVLNMSDESNTLSVRRNAGDLVQIGSGWTQAADEAIGLDTFHVYTQRTATLKVQSIDTDGVTDAVEDAGPGGGDGNGDSIPDSQQSEVTSLPNSADQQYVTLVSPTNTIMVGVAAIPNPSPANSPTGIEFPIGHLAFTVENVSVGNATTVTLYLPDDALVNTYYKYGPTAGDPAPHWYEFLWDSSTGAVIDAGPDADTDPEIVVLHFVDGQRGDDDLSANGQVHDPGSPAFRPNSPPVANAGGQYSVKEGSSVVLSGAESSDPDQSWSTLAYEWDLDNDGIYAETGVLAEHGDEVGITPTFLAGTLDGPSTWPISRKGPSWRAKLEPCTFRREYRIDAWLSGLQGNWAD